MYGTVLVQNVPSFSLLLLKMGFVGWLDTANILPEISDFAQQPLQIFPKFLFLTGGSGNPESRVLLR
jgi:hypothetical protein